MAKKKSRKQLPAHEPEFGRPDTRPVESPYTAGVCCLVLDNGPALSVHQPLLENVPALAALFNEANTAVLQGVAGDAGHVLVHYLLTGRYECLRPTGETSVQRQMEELTTALRTVAAAETLHMSHLAELAMAEIRNFGNAASLVELIDLVDAISPSPLQSEEFTDYVTARVQLFSRELARADNEGPPMPGLDRPSTISKILLKRLAEVQNAAPASPPPIEPVPAPAPATESKVPGHVVPAVPDAEGGVSVVSGAEAGPTDWAGQVEQESAENLAKTTTAPAPQAKSSASTPKVKSSPKVKSTVPTLSPLFPVDQNVIGVEEAPEAAHVPDEKAMTKKEQKKAKFAAKKLKQKEAKRQAKAAAAAGDQLGHPAQAAPEQVLLY